MLGLLFLTRDATGDSSVRLAVLPTSRQKFQLASR